MPDTQVAEDAPTDRVHSDIVNVAADPVVDICTAKAGIEHGLAYRL
jgi:hypothetical protein